MALLKDNEELKNIVKVGFKEVEREMQDMDDVMKKENSARANEVKQVQHLLNEQRDDVETRMAKVEKDLKSQKVSAATVTTGKFGIVMGGKKQSAALNNEVTIPMVSGSNTATSNYP